MTQTHAALVERLGSLAVGLSCTLQDTGAATVKEAAQAITDLEAEVARLRSGLEGIEELTERKQLPLTHQINHIARQALKGTAHG